MSHRFLVAIVIVFAMALAACSGDDSNATDVGSATDPTAAGETEGGGTGDDGAQTAGDVPIPLVPSADAVATSESGPFTIVQYIVPLDQQQATIDFYDNWTDAQTDTYIRSDGGTGGVSWQNDPEPDGEKYIIAVLSPLEGDDFVAVTLTAGPAE